MPSSSDMDHEPSRLFDRPGYISLKEYVNDLEGMRRSGPWKLPLGAGDRVHFFFLSLMARFSWFSDALYVANPHTWSPSYSIIIAYLKRKGLFDDVVELSLRYRGYFSYYFRKNVPLNGKTWEITGQGVSEDRSLALSKSIGEMIERMVTGLHDENTNIMVASPDELLGAKPVLYPPIYHRFLEVQHATQKKLHQDKKSLISWVLGENILTKERTYIPRQMTSWFYGVRNGKEIMMNPTSSGSACYFSKEGALLRGLLEVTHRDAFMVHWLTQIPPKVIVRNTLPEKIQAMIRTFEDVGLSVYALDITSIPIPSVCVVLISDQSEIPQVVVSAASALTFEQSLHNALEEMMTCSSILFNEDGVQLKDASTVTDPFISNISKISRQLYWRGKEKVKKFEWFISGGKVSYEDLRKYEILSEENDADKLEKCVEVLKKMGADYYPVAYFPKNDIPANLGLHVAQVYIPKAFPLYLVEQYGTFDSDRLREFATSKGVAQWELNPLPHMFS